MSKNINIKTLNVNKKQFFTYWLKFLKPYHKLANKEMEIVVLLLIKRHELSKKIKDDSLIDSVLFNNKTRAELVSEMGYSHHGILNNMLSTLRKKNIIIDNKINKGLIPNLDEENGNFKLVFNFNIQNEAKFSE